MAEKTFLNLDDLIDEDVVRTVVYKGEEYPVAGVTGELWLKYLRTEQKRLGAIKDKDRAAQFEEGLNLTLLCVPGLAEKREELLKLKLPILNKMADYVSDEWKSQVPEAEQPGGAEAGGEANAGE